MKVEKIKTYVGFAIRSGEIVFGFDNIMKSKSKIKLILISSTQQEKVANKLIKYGEEKNIKVIKLNDYKVEDFTSRDNCKVIGIINYNLAEVILKELEMEN